MWNLANVLAGTCLCSQNGTYQFVLHDTFLRWIGNTLSHLNRSIINFWDMEFEMQKSWVFWRIYVRWSVATAIQNGCCQCLPTHSSISCDLLHSCVLGIKSIFSSLIPSLLSLPLPFLFPSPFFSPPSFFWRSFPFICAFNCANIPSSQSTVIKIFLYWVYVGSSSLRKDHTLSVTSVTIKIWDKFRIFSKVCHLVLCAYNPIL